MILCCIEKSDRRIGQARVEASVGKREAFAFEIGVSKVVVRRTGRVGKCCFYRGARKVVRD